MGQQGLYKPRTTFKQTSSTQPASAPKSLHRLKTHIASNTTCVHLVIRRNIKTVWMMKLFWSL